MKFVLVFIITVTPQYEIRMSLSNFKYCFYPFCYRITKPQTFADCIGNELPLGWEESYDNQIGVYYINHVNRKFTFFLFHCQAIYLSVLMKIKGLHTINCLDFIYTSVV